MSFLYRTSTIAIRSIRYPTARLFSSSAYRQKTATETVKEPLKKVDRTVSDATVAGIDKGQQAATKAKEAVGLGAKKAEGTASQMTGEAKGKTAEVTGEVKGKASELAGKAKQ